MDLITPYSPAMWQGKIFFECTMCNYDTPDEKEMQNHCQSKHGVMPDPLGGKNLHDWLSEQKPVTQRIVLCGLFMNNGEVGQRSLQSLVDEAERLSSVGCSTLVIYCDNGSTPDNLSLLQQVNGAVGIRNDTNVGISIARNQLIDAAVQFGADYVMFLDGDEAVVPWSVYAMIRWANRRGPKFGAIGPWAGVSQTDPSKATPYFPAILPQFVRYNYKLAFFHYGLFNAKMFKRGMRLEDGGPFGEPGWGLEDTDFYLQMAHGGFSCEYFVGMLFYHEVHSSYRSLRDIDLDAHLERRKRFFIEKWACCMETTNFLNQIRALNMPKQGDGK